MSMQLHSCWNTDMPILDALSYSTVFFTCASRVLIIFSRRSRSIIFSPLSTFVVLDLVFLDVHVSLVLDLVKGNEVGCADGKYIIIPAQLYHSTNRPHGLYQNSYKLTNQIAAFAIVLSMMVIRVFPCIANDVDVMFQNGHLC